MKIIIRFLFVVLVGVTFICASDKGFSQPTKTQNSITLRVPYAFTPEYQIEWEYIQNELIYGRHNPIILLWEGVGGYVYSGKAFIRALNSAYRQGKYVIFNVTGVSWSMHADVVCFGSQIRFAPSGVLKFHAVYQKNRGYNVANKDLNDEYYLFNQCISKGFLTPATRDQIIYNHKAVEYNHGKIKVFNDIDRE